MKHLLLFLLMVVIMPIQLMAQAKTGSLSGTVVDRETLEPLVGASIMLQKISTGEATNIDGAFNISGISSGIYTVVVQYVGYESQFIPDIIIGSNRNTQLEVKLEPEVLEGQEVTVSSGYFSRTDAADISKVSFTPEEIRRSPGAAQELGRVLMATPGVASHGETSQDLLVRGGSPMENGYYIDNIPIPGVRHFENQAGTSDGPIGIVNTELIRNIDFSTGGFSVKHGNHLSSVSSIDYREGTKERIRGDIGANFAGFNGSVEGPFSNKKGSYLLSVRRSYLDIIADAIDTGGAPSYGDIQGKVVYDIDKKNKLTFLNIYGSSLFERDFEDAGEEGFPETIRAENQQNTTGLNWRKLRDRGYTNTSVSYSLSAQDQVVRDVLSEEINFDFENTNQALNFRTASYHKINDISAIEFGADLSYEFADYDYFVAAKTNQGGRQRPDFTRNNSLEGAIGSAFASYTIRPAARLTTTFGTRLGTNSYNTDLNADVNAQIRYQLTPKLGLSSAFGMYHQTLPRYILSQNEAFEELPDTRVFHYIAGFDYLLTEDTKLTVEAFQKEYRNAPILPEKNDINNPSFVLDNAGIFYTTLEDDGTASARGIELLIQKKLAENFYGMISASYFRAQYEDYAGEVQSRDFDNQYLLSLIGGYRPNDTWEVSGRWTWMGGRPYTPIDAAASEQAGTEVLNMNRFNDENMSDFHSLYLRVDRRFFFNRTNFVGFIEIWNTYDHANVDGYFWNESENTIGESTQFSFLPVAGVKFEF